MGERLPSNGKEFEEIIGEGANNFSVSRFLEVMAILDRIDSADQID